MAERPNEDLSLLPDEELLQYLDLDKDEVLSQIYLRYEKRVFFKAKSILKDHNLAMDLTHDVFIRIFTNLQQFKGRSKFSLWVHSITFNTSMKFLSKNKKQSFFEWTENEDINDESAEDINEKVLLEASLDSLENGLEQLNADEKYLLYMKYTDDLSIKDICKITGLKESNVKMRLKRTRDKLAHIIR